MPLMTRAQAKLIAEELYKFMRDDVITATKEMAAEQTDEYLTAEEAAKILGWSVKTLYARKNDINAYTKVGNKLMFSRTQLQRVIGSGKLKRKTSCRNQETARANV